MDQAQHLPRRNGGIDGPFGAGNHASETLTGQRQLRARSYSMEKTRWVLEEFKHHIGYVPQEDVMHRDMTVYEVIYHTAKMRLPNDFPENAIVETVERTITRMGPAHIRDIIGGGPCGAFQRSAKVNIALNLH